MIDTLLVDDEYFVRKGLISTMPWADCGIRIVGEAANGVKALEFMRQHPIDLLITDLSMPLMNGFELMQHAVEEFPHINRVVLSCHEDFKYIQDALRMGAIDYIVKTELEEEKMQESLQRIADRVRFLRKNKESGAEALNVNGDHWSGDQERELQAHIRKWLPLYWALSDEEFASLTQQLKAICPPIGKLRKSMHYLLMEWNRMTEKDFIINHSDKVDKLSNWQEWACWIENLRGEMCIHLNMASYPKDVIVRIFQAVEQIKTHSYFKMTQDDLARQFRMNRGYFSKCFKDLVGRTFQDFVKEQKIMKAENLLLQTAMPVSDIAEECGFLDQRYFSRLFREVTGRLPSEYRVSRV